MTVDLGVVLAHFGVILAHSVAYESVSVASFCSDCLKIGVFRNNLHSPVIIRNSWEMCVEIIKNISCKIFPSRQSIKRYESSLTTFN